MRVAMIVAVVLVSATPSEASKSCMTVAEARQHFGSVHIYWHGPDRCWDATPTRRHKTHKVQRKIPTREVTRKIDQPNIDQPNIDQPKIDQPKWRNSMSEMLADSDPVQSIGSSAGARRYGNDGAVAGTPWIDRWTDIESSPLAMRWVDIAPVERPPIIERKAEWLVSPHGVALVFIVFLMLALALATIEVLFGGRFGVLFGGRFYGWPRSGRAM